MRYSSPESTGSYARLRVPFALVGLCVPCALVGPGCGGPTDETATNVVIRPDAGPDGSPDAAKDSGMDSAAEAGHDSATDTGGSTPCAPKTCTQLEATCGTVPDGCGDKLTCGDCPSGQTCGGDGPNRCGTNECTPKSCTQLGASCGWVSDGCSQAISCGGCPPPLSCGGGGQANMCGCTPKTCQQLGATCGTLPDGCTGSVSCGACSAGQTCGGGGPNVCGTSECFPKSCAQLEASCGIASDGCSDVVHCGECSAPSQCGGAGVANQCGCTPKTCAQLGASCGVVDSGCGDITCGTCAAPDTCGGAGVPNQCGCSCAVPNATTTCHAGVCKIEKCADGFGDCDSKADTGCEAEFATSPAHCGGCGNTCSYANAAGSCASGVCKLGACSGSYGSCDGQESNGCETNLDTTLSHCGACGSTCSLANAAESCAGGACKLGACSSGYGNCDGKDSTGCETNLNTNLSHCGACGRTCGGTCANGLCEITSGEVTRKWHQSYSGSGAPWGSNPTLAYQGNMEYFVAGAGVLKSAIGAPDQMLTDLAGATVLDIWVYMYSPHWYYYAGGTARIGVHGNSTKPTTFPGINQDLSVGFARGEGKWVRLPESWYASFKAGAYRGITLHANGSTDMQYYGYMEGETIKWKWHYRK